MEKHSSDYEFVKEKNGWLKKAGVKKKNKNSNAISFDASDEHLLVCEGVSKAYGATKALSDFSVTLGRGKILGLLGPNGSGKTTLIKLISGLLIADSGEIRVLGHKIGVESKKRVAYLPERNSLPLHFTVAEAVRFYQDFFADFDPSLAEKIIDDLSIDKNKRIKALSKGEREKVNLALVMARRAELYILDEPISGVDPAARDYIIDTVMKNVPKCASVIISTHLIADIERIMDEFVLMKYGELYFSGTPKEIAEKYGKSVDAYFREVFRC